MKLTTNIRTYVFGGAGTAGIGLISGDAGFPIDAAMTEETFNDIVFCHLDGEPEDNGDAVAELRTDFELEAAELYAEFKESCANASADEP